ncbi:mucin-binding protein [Fructilactobacillus sp. Tb1]|uniref:mucin-binding protein n=1 Tax=Fructilactobacillus sp. Tb1 TaxID=3422304 RepID=UPI003D28B28A
MTGLTMIELLKKNTPTLGMARFMVPRKVTQTITYTNVDTKQTVATETFTGLAGQDFSVTGAPLNQAGNANYHVVPTIPGDQSGIVSPFGYGYTFEEHYGDGTTIKYTENADATQLTASLYNPDGTQEQGSYTFGPGYEYQAPASNAPSNTPGKYDWQVTNNAPGSSTYNPNKTANGRYIVGQIYIPETKNINFNVAENGRTIPVDVNGNPISNADQPAYQTDPNDETKVLNPIVPAVDGYTPIDSNGNILTPGQSIPFSDPDDPTKNTNVTYVATDQTTTVKYVNTADNSQLGEDDPYTVNPNQKHDDTTSQVTNWENKGYELDTNAGGDSQFPTNGVDWSAKYDGPVTDTVYLKPIVRTIKPNAPIDNGTTNIDGNSNYPTYPATGLTDGDLNKTVTRTINYQYKDGSQASDPVTETVQYQRTATYNAATKVIEYGTWTANGTNVWDEKDSPAISGYTPDNASEPAITTDGTTQDQTDTVIYSPNNETDTITYTDTTDPNNKIPEDTINGDTGTSTGTTVADHIKNLQNEGYDVSTNPVPDTFGTSNENYNINVTHKIAQVTEPETPGTPIDPNNPDGPKWPAGLAESDLSKTITRTIHYQYADGSQAEPDVVQTVTYTRTAEVDEVTGKVTYHDDYTSTNPDYASVDSDKIQGYTADQTTVPQVETTNTEGNTETTVIYNANPQEDDITYVDQNDGDSKIGTNTLKGVTNGSTGTTVADHIKELQNQGYDLVDNPVPATFGDTDTPQPYQVTLTHRTTTITPDTVGTPGQPIDANYPDGPKYPATGMNESDLNNTVTRTIHYKYADGTTAAPDKTESVQYVRNATIDEVTGKITYSAWMTKDGQVPYGILPSVDSPEITNYTPDQAKVDELSTQGEETVPDVTVVYNHNKVVETVNYVDQDGNGTLATNTLNGLAGDKNDYSTADEKDALEKQGYEVVSDGYPAGSNFDGTDTTYQVTLKHAIKTVTPDDPQNEGTIIPGTDQKYPAGVSESDLNKTITRTIHFVDKNGNQLKPDETQTVTYSRTAEVDEVTGKVTYGPWNVSNGSASYPAAPAPAIAGYTPSVDNIDENDFTPESADSDTTIVYDADDESATVNYVDADDNNKPLASDTINGKNAEKADYSTKDELADLGTKGYEVDVNGYPADGYTFTNEPDQTITVTMKHKHVTVNPDDPQTEGTIIPGTDQKFPAGVTESDLNKTITRTIHFVDKNGNQLKPDETQTVTYTRTASVDEVTGQVTYSDWGVSSGIENNPATPAPTIAGYTPSVDNIDENDFKPDDSDSETTIVYDADNESATVNYVDGDENNKPLASDIINGKNTEKADYSTKDEISDLGAKGYEVSVNGYPADGYTFTNDPNQTITVTMKHKLTTVTPSDPQTAGTTIPETDQKFPAGVTENDLSQTITRTIHFVDKNGNQLKPDETQTVTYNRTATVDDVTGQVTYTPWTVAAGQDTYDSQPTPNDIPGYKPSVETIDGVGFNPGDQDSNTTIVYDNDNESATVNYVDGDNGNSVLQSDKINGKYQEKADYSTADEISALGKKGYEVSVNGYPADGYTFTNEPNQTLTVTMKHKIATVTPADPQAEGTIIPGTDQQYPAGLTESDLSQTITRTIHFVDKNGNQLKPDETQTVTYNRTASVDEVTGQVTYTPWNVVAGQDTYASEPTPDDIPGYKPSDDTIDGIGFNPDDQDSNTIIVYDHDNESAKVTYVDVDDGNKVLQSDNLNGQYTEKADYSPADEISALEKKGYAVDVNGYPADGYTFTNDPDQSITITMKHKIDTITPSDPQAAGTTIPGTDQQYPAGLTESDLSQTITRTIHFVDKNGKQLKPDEVQSVTYNRTATVDEVTGQVTYTPWNVAAGQDLYGSQPTPNDIPGYKPSVDTIDGIGFNIGDQDSNTTIVYDNDNESATVNYVDGDNGNSMLQSDTINGNSGAKADYSTTDEISALEKKGYEVSVNGYPADGYTFTNDPNQSITVTMKHKLDTITAADPQTAGTIIPGTDQQFPAGLSESDLTQTVPVTVHFVDPDGHEIAPSVTQEVKYTRTATVDEVTGKVTYGDWVPVNGNDISVISPDVTGYITPENPTEVSVTPYTSPMNVNVVYQPRIEHAKVTYIDDTTGKTITVDSIQGAFGSEISQAEVDQLKSEGYDIVSDNVPAKFGSDDNQAYEVHLVHRTVTTNATKTVTRTIHFVDANGKTLAPDVVEQVEFTRTVTTDQVTGEVVYGPWVAVGDATFNGMTLSDINGLVPNIAAIAAMTVTGDAEDSEISVIYSEPVVPAQPTPTEPAPTVPAKQPATPAEPQPVAAKPVVKAAPAKTSPTPAQPQNKVNALPDTGESHQQGLLAILGAVLLGFLGLFGFKRKHE